LSTDRAQAKSFPPVRFDAAVSVDWKTGLRPSSPGDAVCRRWRQTRCRWTRTTNFSVLFYHSEPWVAQGPSHLRWTSGKLETLAPPRFVPLRQQVKFKVKFKVVGAAHTCQRRRLWTPQGAEGPLTPAKLRFATKGKGGRKAQPYRQKIFPHLQQNAPPERV